MNAEDRKDDRDELLAAEYALGVLPHGERQAFEKRLAQDSELRRRVERWDGHFLDLADEIEPVSPPAGIMNKVEARLFEPEARPASWFSSLFVWRALTAASLALAIAVGALYLGESTRGPDAGKAYVAGLVGETSALRLVAIFDPAASRLRLNRIAGDAAEGRSLELWLIAGQDKPVSLGVLPSARDASFEVPAELLEKAKNATFAISDEPPGGSPTGQPTGDVLAAGQMTAM